MGLTTDAFHCSDAVTVTSLESASVAVIINMSAVVSDTLTYPPPPASAHQGRFYAIVGKNLIADRGNDFIGIKQ